MPRSRRSDEGALVQLVYYAYLVGAWLARSLPERAAYGIAHFLGAGAARLSRRRKLVETHLARITGEPAGSIELQDLVRAAYISYARYWLETFRLVEEDRRFFLERFHCEGQEYLDDALGHGRGAIVVAGHLGNWDAAGAWLGATGRRLVTVAEEVKPRKLFEFFVRHRTRLGMKIYPARPSVTTRLMEEVLDGTLVAIVGDRDLKGRGPEVTFFGERATFPPGPASMALRTGAPLLIAGVYSAELERGRWGWTAEISEPIEPPAGDGAEAVCALTQQIADRLALFIARRPEEWHVFQPFWLVDRERR